MYHKLFSSISSIHTTYYIHTISSLTSISTALLGWLGTHVRGIVSIRLKVLTETTVLLLDSVLNINQPLLTFTARKATYLSNVRNKNPAQHRTENAKGTRDDKRILASADWVGSMVLRNGKHIRTDKGTDLANGGGDAVVLAANRGCAALGCQKTDVVARTEFAEGGEDTNRVSVPHTNLNGRR